MKNIKINLFTLLIACSGITFASSQESKKLNCAQLFEIFDRAKAQAQIPNQINEGVIGIVPGNHVYPARSSSLFNICKKEWLKNPENNDYQVYLRSISSIDKGHLDSDDLAKISVGALKEYSAFRNHSNDTP